MGSDPKFTMPRKRRVDVPGYPMHVIIRGNDRGAIFRYPHDRRRFISYLEKATDDTGVHVHTYCLMTNHVHLLLTPLAPGNVSICMQDLGRRYVRYFNDRYGRTGTLWEGRFRSFLIQGDTYLLACGRYIELNPVRAGIVHVPGEWRWSGYRARAEGQASSWLQPDPAYLGLAETPVERQARYRAWVALGTPHHERERLQTLIRKGGIFSKQKH